MEYTKEQFAEAIALYKEWNGKINVISRKDIDNVYEHHILHSLAIARHLEGRVQPGDTFLDVGTGGGFPGIPLAIAFPDCHFTLCDSIGKKIRVASSVAEGLGLQNVRFLNCRAEAVEWKFDWVVSRAVTSLDLFYPWVRSRYRKGIVCLKGGDVEREISEMCTKHGIARQAVSVRPVSDFLKDEYYQEKYIVEI